MSTLEELSTIAYELFLADFADHNPQQFCIALNPVPASRPRVFRNGGVSYGDKYKAFKQRALVLCRAFMGRKSGKPIACLIEHVVQRPKNPSNPYPVGDIDNYDKAPLDAMVKSGCFFEDDIQVVFMISIKRYANDREQPCCNVVWFDFDM